MHKCSAAGTFLAASALDRAGSARRPHHARPSSLSQRSMPPVRMLLVPGLAVVAALAATPPAEAVIASPQGSPAADVWRNATHCQPIKDSTRATYCNKSCSTAGGCNKTCARPFEVRAPAAAWVSACPSVTGTGTPEVWPGTWSAHCHGTAAPRVEGNPQFPHPRGSGLLPRAAAPTRAQALRLRPGT